MDHNSLFIFIKNSIDILDVVSFYIALKRAGSYYKGLSPFKPEKTASFTISPSKKIFYCFSTNQGGDVIDFISKMKKITQLQAAMYLVEKYNLTIPKEYHYVEPKKEITYHNVNQFFAEWCSEHAKNNIEVINYLKERKISYSMQLDFNIGYAPNLINDLIKKAQEKNVLVSDLEKALILLKNQSGGYYLPYYDRIIFPIHDIDGNCVGFGARIFKEGDTRAKYYNSHAHDEFSKKKILYNIDKAKNTIHKERSVFLVEGYFDTLSLYQSGYYNVVCSMGTACTVDHLDVLERHADKIIAMYDGDLAGFNALLKLSKLCWNRSFDLDIILLPKNEDPSSLLLKGHDLKTYIQQKKTSISFFIEYIESEYKKGSLKDKIHYIEEIIQTIESLDCPLKKNIMYEELKKTMNIPLDFIKKRIIQDKKNNIITHTLSSNNEITAPIISSQKSTLKDSLDPISIKLFICFLQLSDDEKKEKKKELDIIFNIDDSIMLKKLIDIYEKEMISLENKDFDIILFLKKNISNQAESIIKEILEKEYMGKMYSDLMFVLKKTLAKILIEESKKQSMEDKKLMTDNLMNKLKLLI